MHNRRQRIHRVAVQEDIHLHELRLLIIRQFIIQRSITLGRRFQAVKVVKNDFIERNMIGNHDAVGIEIVHVLEHAPLVLRNLHDCADKIIGHNHRRLDKRFLNMLNLRLRRQFCRIADV